MAFFLFILHRLTAKDLTGLKGFIDGPVL